MQRSVKLNFNVLNSSILQKEIKAISRIKLLTIAAVHRKKSQRMTNQKARVKLTTAPGQMLTNISTKELQSQSQRVFYQFLR